MYLIQFLCLILALLISSAVFPKATNLVEYQAITQAAKLAHKEERYGGFLAELQEAAKSEQLNDRFRLVIALFYQLEFYQEGDANKLMRSLTEIAEQDHMEAELILAELYSRGKRELKLRKDEKLSMYWYTRIAERGYLEYQLKVANYAFAEGRANADFDAAMYWYGQAVEQGSHVASLRLAEIYDKGLGIEKDVDRAIGLYKEAGKVEGGIALYRLGRIYMYGDYVLTDAERGIHYFKQAVESGNKEARYEMALAYERGAGVQQDLDRAADWYGRFARDAATDEEKVKWLKKAAELGSTEFIRIVGTVYLSGRYGIEKNYEIAMQWFMRAANLGDPEAYAFIASMYEEGLGVPRSEELARAWFEKALELREKQNKK